MDTDAATWRRAFDTNVIRASLVTAAAVPHLMASGGAAAYLSSVSASVTPPWPGLGAYAVSKAALDTLVEAWRAEHPEIGFTRVVVGDCAGGEGFSTTEFINAGTSSCWPSCTDLGGPQLLEWILDGRLGAGPGGRHRPALRGHCVDPLGDGGPAAAGAAAGDADRLARG